MGGADARLLRSSCEQRAAQLGIEVRYLASGGVDKEALARSIAAASGVREDGAICMFSVVEPCQSMSVVGNRETKHLEVRMQPRKCVFIYYYFDHPELGFGHVRVQTWAPYTVHVCLNGRHWLEKQLLAHGIDYAKRGNCFTWVADTVQAQELLDAQLRTKWPVLLDGLVSGMCPSLHGLCAPFQLGYYWSAEQTEYATDVMFESSSSLNTLFPTLLAHGMRVSDSRTVMRYLGKGGENATMGRMPKEVKTDLRARHEGVRLKHWVNENSIKMYNKEGSVLRVETTINNPRGFKAFRAANDEVGRPPTWQKMRKGVNDLHRRAEVSKQANSRYLDAMSAAQVQQTLHEVVQNACNRTMVKGRSVRGLNPWNAQDFRLLTFLAKGEWAINGFRNTHLCQWLQPDHASLSKHEQAKLSARTTRLINLLRAHGLVAKVQHENRYQLTQKGRTFANALMMASTVKVQQLTELAA
ncbi:MAG: hypothetical protein HC888_18545 [Candidatus Competibacteraceae bacterium]|nr:hypothetical protein [Candidatus Competibacteraceae bacterium]